MNIYTEHYQHPCSFSTKTPTTARRSARAPTEPPMIGASGRSDYDSSPPEFRAGAGDAGDGVVGIRGAGVGAAVVPVWIGTATKSM